MFRRIRCSAKVGQRVMPEGYLCGRYESENYVKAFKNLSTRRSQRAVSVFTFYR